MDKMVTTVFLIVASVIAAVLVFNAAYPAVVQGNTALMSMQGRIEERLRSQVAVVHGVKAGDYADVALLWVKNIGSTSIRAVERCDIFFGPEGNFERIPHGGLGDPRWEYQVENDSYWNPGATLRIRIDLDYPLLAGERYFFRIVTPNGVSDQFFFSPSR